jgi:hypothetical protein
MSWKSFISNSSLLLLLVAVLIAPSVRAKDEKLKPEQLIAKHLASIGSPDTIKMMKTRIVQGSAHFSYRVGGQANMDGAGTLLSEGDSIRVGLKFPALQYPGEQMATDGNKVSIAKINPANWSPLGQFVRENDELLKEGLMFGTLSTGWALLNQGDRQPKLEINGPKKMDGKSVYELKYMPKHRNGNVSAFFYFDAETFRHIRSEFKAENVPVSGGGGGGGRGGRGGGGGGGGDRGETIKTTITEQFDDFKPVDGVTLPHSYKMEFAYDSPNGGFVQAYSFTVMQVAHNQPIEKQLFTVN